MIERPKPEHSKTDRLTQALANPSLLARLARDAEGGDPIDWRDVSVDPDAAYALMATQIAEMFARYEAAALPRDEQLLLALATIVKLSTETFVLHQRLLGREG